MRSMPVTESATRVMHPLPPAPNAGYTAATPLGDGITMINPHGTHHGARYSAIHSATYAHTQSNVDGSTLPATPARQRLVSSFTDRILPVHSKLSGTHASRLSHPPTAFFRAVCLRPTALLRSIALLVWALTASCFTLAQDVTSNTATDASEVEEVVVSSRTPDLIDQIGVSVSVLDEDMMQSMGYPDLASCSIPNRASRDHGWRLRQSSGGSNPG